MANTDSILITNEKLDDVLDKLGDVLNKLEDIRELLAQ